MDIESGDSSISHSLRPGTLHLVRRNHSAHPRSAAIRVLRSRPEIRTRPARGLSPSESGRRAHGCAASGGRQKNAAPRRHAHSGGQRARIRMHTSITKPVSSRHSHTRRPRAARRGRSCRKLPQAGQCNSRRAQADQELALPLDNRDRNLRGHEEPAAAGSYIWRIGRLAVQPIEDGLTDGGQRKCRVVDHLPAADLSLSIESCPPLGDLLSKSVTDPGRAWRRAYA